MTNILINGERFELDTLWPVNEVRIPAAPADSGGYSGYGFAYDPAGPNAGDDVNASVIQWTDTAIELDFTPDLSNPYIPKVILVDVTGTQTIEHDFTPYEPAVPAGASAAYSDADNGTITVTDPDGSFSGLVTDPMGVLWWGASPSEHVAPDLIVDSPTQVRFVNLNNYGIVGNIFHIDLRDDANVNYPGTLVFAIDVDIRDYEDADEGTVRRMVSNVANRMELTGVRFTSAPVRPVDQISVRQTGPGEILKVYDPAGPNAGLQDPGTTIVSWTDTSIIFDHALLAGTSYGFTGNDESQLPLGYVQTQTDIGGTIENYSPSPAVFIAP